jgi:chromosome segregation ATPase
MFPHPFQMALMGYWLSESQHREAGDYVRRLEAYARRLEKNLEAALRERAEWEKHAKDVENRWAALTQESETFCREVERLKGLLVEAKKHKKTWEERQEELEKELRATGEKLRDLETAMKSMIARHRTLVRDTAKLKAFLQEFFGDQAPRLLTPLGLRHCQMVLRFIQRLPDDPGEGSGP